MALKSLEIFVDFLDHFELKNTKEIFMAETNYKKNDDIYDKLNKDLSDDDNCMGVKLLRRFDEKKNEEIIISLKEEKNKVLKVKMDDLKAKSDKLDMLIQRKKLEYEQNSEDFNDSLKNSFTKKKVKKSPLKHDNLFENDHLKKKINPEKLKENEIQITESKKESEISLKESNKLISISNINESKEKIFTGSDLKNNKEDNDHMLISESHGYDVTVNTEALEEFDYIESINDSENDNDE